MLREKILTSFFWLFFNAATSTGNSKLQSSPQSLLKYSERGIALADKHTMGEGNVQVQGGVGLLKLYAAKGRFEGASVGDEHSGGGGAAAPGPSLVPCQGPFDVCWVKVCRVWLWGLAQQAGGCCYSSPPARNELPAGREELQGEEAAAPHVNFLASCNGESFISKVLISLSQCRKMFYTRLI